MFHLIFLSPHFIVRTSLLFPAVHSPSHSFYLSQSISFIFALFGCLHITWSFNHIVSFTFRPIFSLGISSLRVSLDKYLILDRYSLLEAELRWFYCSLSLYIGGEIWRSSSCSVEISVLMFCSMMLRDGRVLPGYLLPGLAGVGAWSLGLVGVARGSCWSQLAILGLVLIATQLINTNFISNNRVLFYLWWK